ncbi:hypothetical protein D3C75_1140820 [compost metagenome]
MKSGSPGSGKNLGILEVRGGLVFCRQLRYFAQLPVDGQVRVVPANAALGGRGVVVGGFVEKLGEVTQHHETMGETFRNP